MKRFYEDCPDSYNYCINISIKYGNFVRGSVLPTSLARTCYFSIKASRNEYFVERHEDIFGYIFPCQSKSNELKDIEAYNTHICR